jgi:hypothetical protein
MYVLQYVGIMQYTVLQIVGTTILWFCPVSKAFASEFGGETLSSSWKQGFALRTDASAVLTKAVELMEVFAGRRTYRS